jgi:HSP20 family protein
MTARAIIPTLDRMLTLDPELNRVLGRVVGLPATNDRVPAFVPPIDVTETETAYIIAAELPGVDPTAFELTFERNVLTLRGRKPATQPSEAHRVHAMERTGGEFERSLRLPGMVDSDRITATHAHGLLTVTVPKAAQAMPKKIEIR